MREPTSAFCLLPSSLHTADHDPGNVMPLQRKEKNQDRKDREHGAGHHQLCVLDVLADEVRHCDRQRVPRTVREDDQRPHEIVPGRHEHEDRQGHQDGARERHHDRPVDAEFSGAVDARRVEQIVGDRQHELADQKNAEDCRHARENHTPVAVHEMHALQNQEQRQHAHLCRNHQRRHEQVEKSVAAAESKLGERVAGHGIQEQRKKRDRRCDDHAVRERAAEIHSRK